MSGFLRLSKTNTAIFTPCIRPLRDLVTGRKIRPLPSTMWHGSLDGFPSWNGSFRRFPLPCLHPFLLGPRTEEAFAGRSFHFRAT